MGRSFITIIAHIRRGHTHFYFSAPASDWTDPQNPSLWQDGVKTLYDPCPAGWRVPRSGIADSGGSPWGLLSLTNSSWVKNGALTGRRFDNTVVQKALSAWYPVTGLRNGTKGVHSNINTEGAVWSVTASATSPDMSYGFGLFENSVEPARNHFRGHGISVRCIRE